MKDWTPAWVPQAQADQLLVHWETAERIDAAVQRFATTGEGLRRIVIEGVARPCLLVPPYAAIVSIERSARVVWVWQVVRYAP